MRKPKSVSRVPGDILRITLEDGFHSYARIITSTMLAFHDCRTQDELSVEDIIALPVMFMLSVHNSALAQPNWNIMGNAPLKDALLRSPPRFVQDALHKDRFRIYEDDEFRSATREECVGLERFSVWDASHVEDRLRDHYAGRPNKWVESLKIRN